MSPLNISYNKSLVMMSSLNFTLFGKHFICTSSLNDNFAGYSNLGCRSLPFMTLNTSFQPLLACKISFEKSAYGNSFSGNSLFFLFSCCFEDSLLILGNIIIMYLGVGFLGSNFFGTLSFPDFLEVYFLC